MRLLVAFCLFFASVARAGGVDCDKPQLALLHYFAPEWKRKAVGEELAGEMTKIRDELDKAIRAAKKDKPSVSLIVTPEMAATSYPDEIIPGQDSDYKNEEEARKVAEILPEPGFVPGEGDIQRLQKESPTFLHFSRLAKELSKNGKTTLHIGIAERDAAGKVYNAVAVIGPEGQLITKHRKTHLSKEAGEQKYFSEAPINVGTSTYDHPGIGRVGLAICSDVDDDGDGKEDLMYGYRNAKPPLDLIALSSLWFGQGEKNGPENIFSLAVKGTTVSGRLLARTVDGHPLRYTYDTARRLTVAQVDTTTYGYTWDLANRLRGRTITSPGGTDTFSYTYDGADRLATSSDPDATIPSTGAYDADDNHTRIGADSFTYDAVNQLAATTNETTGTTITSARDPQRRVTTHTSNPGGTYHLGYSLPDDQRPTLTIDATGTASPLLSLPGGLLFRGTAAGPILADMAGNALLTLTPDGRRPTAADGTPVPVTLYEPFGAAIPGDASTPGTAGDLDPGWGLNPADGPLTELGARTLDTRLGTFLQPDPHPLGSGAGPYSYTNADPVNQSDPNGLCSGWACVKTANEYLQPITDALSLFACVLGFGIACVVTSLLRLAVSVLNFAADFELHQDAAYDGVTAAMALLNLAAATPLLYEARAIGQYADEIGAQRDVMNAAVRDVAWNGMREDVLQLRQAFSRPPGLLYDNIVILRQWNRVEQLAVGMTRARGFLAFSTLFTTGVEYGSRITSGTLYHCCWKLW